MHTAWMKQCNTETPHFRRKQRLVITQQNRLVNRFTTDHKFESRYTLSNSQIVEGFHCQHFLSFNNTVVVSLALGLEN